MSVKLYVYDLSRGMAQALSPQFLGFQIDGVWHTSVVYNGTEIYYGAGIQKSVPGQTHHGMPVKVIDMGTSEIPQDVLDDYLADMADEYSAQKYNLFDHNCNHMSSELCQLLVGKPIPEYISNLPKQVLDTPFGQMLRPMIEQAMMGQVMA